jgi:hypothetical protein
MEGFEIALLNTARDGRMPMEFHGDYHVHIIVRRGVMTFSDGKNMFTSREGDLVIWQILANFRKQDSADASTYISFLCLCYVTISNSFLRLHIILSFS